jgi:hypothetical protein
MDMGENPMSASHPTSQGDLINSEDREGVSRVKTMSVMFPHHALKLPEKKAPPPKIPHIDHVTDRHSLPPAVRASNRPIPDPPLLPGMRATIRRMARLPSAAMEKVPLSVGPMPTKKMKMLFWNKINEKKGLWEEVNKIQVTQLHINFQRLEEKFSLMETETGSGHGGKGLNVTSSSSSQNKKNKKISIIDSKRSHLIEISLNRIKKLPEEIASMLIQLDPEILTMDLTEILLSILPTSKEIELIKSFHGDITTLGLVEQVILTISPIPRLEKRLWCHRTVFVWPHAMDKSIGQLNILESGCDELLSESSQSFFITLFSFILSVGNYLNSGTHRVAHAIHLDSLLKLSTIKANTTNRPPGVSNANSSNSGRQKETLLHYILSEMISHSTHSSDTSNRPILDITRQYKYLLLLSDINYQQIQLEYKQAIDEYQRVKNEYDLLARPSGAGNATVEMNLYLQQRLEQFLIVSQERILSLDQYFLSIQ